MCIYDLGVKQTHQDGDYELFWNFKQKNWFAACDDGEYGENCKYNCSGNCLNGTVCDPQTGTCQSCAGGFKGEKCDQSTWSLHNIMFYLQFSWRLKPSKHYEVLGNSAFCIIFSPTFFLNLRMRKWNVWIKLFGGLWSLP